ncbi:MAG: hypothetical protein ACK41Y_15755 [Paracoccus hibiscisoli]|uniref:hypothetical protein n=1 Tax=Paracoccus hibiscisoli TaxID=2023261 RepID=UPI00391CF0C0
MIANWASVRARRVKDALVSATLTRNAAELGILNVNEPQVAADVMRQRDGNGLQRVGDAVGGGGASRLARPVAFQTANIS